MDDRYGRCIEQLEKQQMLKAYKYKLYPNKEQKNMLERQFGMCRFVYNLALEQKIKYYETEKKSLSCFAIMKQVTELKKQGEFKWLTEGNSQALQQAIRNLDNAFTNFFRDKTKKTGFPKWKSKKNPVQSFQIPQHYSVNFEKNKIKLPKLGLVNGSFYREFDGTPKTATVSRTSTGKYYISILIDNGKELPTKQEFNESTTLGVDVGIKDFAILSNGEKIGNPKHLKSSLHKLKTLSRELSRKQKDSNNFKKAKLKLAKLHEKVSNQRNDFQHKLSLKLVNENQAIALETLNIQGLVKNHRLAQAISDAGWYNFVLKLTYKAEWLGKNVLRIGTFEPSSKLCSVCGFHNSELTLAVREWICPECKTKHDRDVNAAVNIKKFALQDQNLIMV